MVGGVDRSGCFLVVVVVVRCLWNWCWVDSFYGGVYYLPPPRLPSYFYVLPFHPPPPHHHHHNHCGGISP